MRAESKVVKRDNLYIKDASGRESTLPYNLIGIKSKRFEVANSGGGRCDSVVSFGLWIAHGRNTGRRARDAQGEGAIHRTDAAPGDGEAAAGADWSYEIKLDGYRALVAEQRSIAWKPRVSDKATSLKHS